MKPGDKPQSPRCPLGELQPIQMDAEAIKSAAWQDLGILVVSLDDCRLTWPETEIIKQLGEKLHGKKRPR